MTSPEARRRWEASNREKRNLQKNIAKQMRKHERNDRDRERRFRFGKRINISRYAEMGLFVGMRNSVEDPVYIFEFNGRRHKERLTEKLPVW